VKEHNFSWGYTWTKTFLYSKGLLEKAKRRGAHRRKRERRPLPGMMLHQDGSMHVWLAGQPALDLIVTLDDATSAIYSAFLIEEEGTASTFRALMEVFGSHGLPMSLYTDRGAHYFYTPTAAAKLIARDRRRSGVHWSVWASSISRPTRRRRADARSGCFTPCRIDWSRSCTQRDRHGRSGKPVSVRCLYPEYNAGSRSRLRRKARRLWRSLASTLRRFYASRRSVRSATIIACRSTAQAANTGKPLRAHFVKTRVKVRQYQMEPMRFSTGRDALDATIKRAFSMKKEKPLESARRPACGNVDKASALTTVPQENKNRRSGLLMCYQIRQVN